MRCFDGHCDTLARCMTTGEGLRQNGGHVDLARCAAAGGGPPFGRASVNALRKGLYLNVAEAVTVKNDCLRKELTSDGIHLHTAECVEWRAYLKAHPVEKGL